MKILFAIQIFDMLKYFKWKKIHLKQFPYKMVKQHFWTLMNFIFVMKIC